MQPNSPADLRPLIYDPQRPGYHFLPPANWMNDPNGLIEWNGRYHMFYQYNPNGAFHGTIHWGHAVSDDLVHWEHLPIALAPTPGGPDADGCWSGCAVDDNGIPTLIYSGVFPQVVCLARGDKDLIHWIKQPESPVLAAAPKDIANRNGGHFRDPYVWKENDAWYMLIGSQIESVGGLILLYRSIDLLKWEYMHPFITGDQQSTEIPWSGTMWECPFPVRMQDGQTVLIFSAQATPEEPLYPIYASGEMDDFHFMPARRGVLVHGGSYYAPQAIKLSDGRPVAWGWMQEDRSQQACERAGWAGVMSLPSEIVTWDDGVVGLKPVAELEGLRKEHHSWSDVFLGEAENLTPASPRNDCLEIHAEVVPSPGAEFYIDIRFSPEGQELTRILFQTDERKVIIDRSKSSLNKEMQQAEIAAELEIEAGATLPVHIFIDRSTIEGFLNHGRTNLATRIYPERSDSQGIRFGCLRAEIQVRSLDIWRLSPI